MIHFIQALEKGDKPTEERVAQFLPGKQLSNKRKIERYSERWRNYGCDWAEMVRAAGK
jgi:hypothetical protein